MRYTFLVFSLLAGTLAGIWGCRPTGSGSPGGVTRAFYWWSSRRPDPASDSLMKRMDVKKVYVHFFDVDVDAPGGQPYPIYGDSWYYDSSVLPGLDSLEIVPTVFITNRTFMHGSDTAIADLANRIHKKINDYVNGMAYTTLRESGQPADYGMRDLFRRDSLRDVIHGRIPEIQFDCDWTPSTKDRYFLFLQKIKAKFPDKTVSSTVRLYGYKYPDKAGVPPVDKGMLMCYNAGELRTLNPANSIFDKREILEYLDTDKPYPLPLDYALPVFEWCAVYRNGKLQALLSTDELYLECTGSWCSFERDKAWTEEMPVYKAIQEYTVGYTQDALLIKKGDLVKVERPDLADVAAVARALGKSNTNPRPVLTLFHFDTKNVMTHEKAIEKIYRSF